MSEQVDLTRSVEIAELARTIGISSQHLRRVIDRAGVARTSHGQVELLAAVRAYVRSVRADLERRRARTAGGSHLQRAKAAAIEARNQRVEADLIAAPEHREIFRDQMAMLRAAFAEVPARASQDVTIQSSLSDSFAGLFADAERRFEDLTEKRRQH